MNFLESQLKTSESWEILSRNFFAHWEEAGFGNLDKTKLEALLAYCLHIQGVIPADGFRITLAEAHALNKEPADLDKLIAKGYTLFHKEPINTDLLIDTTLRCLISTQDRIVNGSLEFHCASELDKRYVMEFFERCGINPEQGRNSRILIVELSGIDSNRINASAVFNGLCAQLGVINPKKADDSTDKGGRWFISCLQLSGPELFKSGVSVVARELFTRLLLGH